MKNSNNKTECPYGSEYQKYWDLLSIKERMMKFDTYSLYAITPRLFSEPIIKQIQGDLIIDACCSVGGMSIALAEAGKHVIGIELNAYRLQLAKENAEKFGVIDRITFIEGDVLEVIPTLQADTIFFDGQWIGEHKETNQKFSLSDFSPNGEQFLEKAFLVTDAVVLRVPAKFNFIELSKFHQQYKKEATLVGGESVAYTVYFGHS